MSTPTRPLFNSGRESPFKRQNSTAIRGSTPTRETSSNSLRGSTPTRETPPPSFHRASSSLSQSVSPTKNGSLSPEKASPFVRRPSQNSQASTSRPASPFARSNSALEIPGSPSRSPSRASSGMDREKRGSVIFNREESRGSLSFSRQNSLAPEPTPEPEPSPTLSETTEAQKTETNPAPRSLPSGAERKSSITPDSPSPYDGAHASPAPHSPAPPTLDSPFDGARTSSRPNLFESPSAQKVNLRPTAQRTVTSSTTTTLRQPNFNTTEPASPASLAPKPHHAPTTKPPSRLPTAPPAGGNYTHLPPPLLHSLRESFEVLDTDSANALTPASLTKALASSGLDPSTLPPTSDFFPPTNSTTTPPTLNLSQYLTSLTSPMSNLSSPEELSAAFGAFDLEDSGQIDAEALREAVMTTAPEVGEEDFRLGEEEVEAAMAAFVGRRAFTGAATVGSPQKKGRGEVFRWREFVGAVAGVEGTGVGVGG
ncbi:hypothetical protein MBLNU230_g2462t1 [Neophaeotheca triangularis]